MRTGIFAICLCLFGFLAGSCEKLTECPEIEKVAICRILPKLDMELETDRVVNSTEELLSVLESNPGRELTILDEIDFENFTLLLGKGYCTGTVYMDSHLFMQKDDFFYLYQVKISGYGDTPEKFVYGMVVEKLPEDTVVQFDVIY